MPGDIWKIDPDYVEDFTKDPIFDQTAIVVKHDIPPEALKLRSDIGRYWPRDEESKQKFNNPPWKHDERVQRGEQVLGKSASLEPIKVIDLSGNKQENHGVGHPYIYDRKSNSLLLGKPGGYHQDIIPHNDYSQLVQGRVSGDQISTYDITGSPTFEDRARIKEALQPHLPNLSDPEGTWKWEEFDRYGDREKFGSMGSAVHLQVVHGGGLSPGVLSVWYNPETGLAVTGDEEYHHADIMEMADLPHQDLDHDAEDIYESYPGWIPGYWQPATGISWFASGVSSADTAELNGQLHEATGTEDQNQHWKFTSEAPYQSGSISDFTDDPDWFNIQDWQEGHYGKGLITPDNKIYTWSNEHPVADADDLEYTDYDDGFAHAQIAHQLNHDYTGDGMRYFHIDPEGKVNNAHEPDEEITEGSNWGGARYGLIGDERDAVYRHLGVDHQSQGDWKFTGSEGPQVVRVNDPYGGHGMGHAFYYLPHERKLYIGSPGSYHAALEGIDEEGADDWNSSLTGRADQNQFTLHEGNLEALHPNHVRDFYDAFKQVRPQLEDPPGEYDWDGDDWDDEGQFNEPEQWHFANAEDLPKVTYVDEGRGTHGSGHAFIYRPQIDTVVVGAPGSFHTDLDVTYAPYANYSANNLPGRVSPSGLQFYTYTNLHKWKPHMDRIRKALAQDDRIQFSPADEEADRNEFNSLGPNYGPSFGDDWKFSASKGQHLGIPGFDQWELGHNGKGFYDNLYTGNVYTWKRTPGQSNIPHHQEAMETIVKNEGRPVARGNAFPVCFYLDKDGKVDAYGIDPDHERHIYKTIGVDHEPEDFLQQWNALSATSSTEEEIA